MAGAGLDALFLTTEPEFRYFTGFLTQFWQSPTRPWFLVVPREGAPIAVIPEIGAPLLATTWIKDVRTWASPQPEDEGVSLLADTLGNIPGSRIRVGVPMGPETTLRMPLKDYGQLKSLVPGIEFVDATDVIRNLRMIKSETEIAKIAHICRIASDAFDRVPEIVSAGQPLSEAFRAFKIELLNLGADDVPYLVGASDPGGYDNVISPPDNRPLCSGDVLMLDTGAVYDGYFCDFDRNYAIGRADDDARRGYDTLFRATEAAFDVARPGATSADLFRAMQAVITDDQYDCGNVGRLGHGLGMQLTEWPSHTAEDHTILVPGMVLTLEPGLWLGPGRSMVHEENLVIREGGAELLSRRATADLPEIL
ncbi:Xaa-Pro peptidase family protein [Arthrobacter sp. PAMC25284]|uniref:M24 family metallopeptidase n=1 Tax=Arthrobacter sp. PAMC25284 TaxID=2861279 RepID=UPI001C632E1A|nr:Xaa-Pro peptidase family protein [Arthrobacter sp. PAMC25284]QYF89157.1 Xaa-Pro peptidase family protein [Arthrobacter sp. PAMC25284]